MDKKSMIAKYDEYASKSDQTYSSFGVSTKCIHAGQDPDMVYGAVNVPIYLSSTFAQDKPGEPLTPYLYSRLSNPTRSRLERAICSLENGKYSLIWASGMAAIAGVANLLKVGDEAICIDDVYGGTQVFFRELSSEHGIKVHFVDFGDLESYSKSLTENIKLIWLETPTNPQLKTADIGEVVRITREFNPEIIIAVDNTFMSPYNSKPLDFGVDIVMESATKYLNGHSDVVMGITCTNREDLQTKLHKIQIYTGGISPAFDCYLTLRGLKTLSIRVEKQNYNTLEIAKFLEQHQNVSKVLYPGLESSPYHEIAKKQQKGFGGVLSFIIKGGMEESKIFLGNLKLFTFAVSLGSVESLAEHPGMMTHSNVPPEIRKQLGINDGLIRLAIGIEDVEDLIKDLDNALNAIDR